MPKRINHRHRKFVAGLIKGKRQYKAYMEAYPEASPDTARNESSKLLKREDVQRELERQCEEITPEWIMANWKGIAVHGKRDADKLRAGELLARTKKLGMFSDSSTNQLNIITQGELDAIRSKIQVASDTKEKQALPYIDVNPNIDNSLENKSV